METAMMMAMVLVAMVFVVMMSMVLLLMLLVVVVLVALVMVEMVLGVAVEVMVLLIVVEAMLTVGSDCDGSVDAGEELKRVILLFLIMHRSKGFGKRVGAFPPRHFLRIIPEYVLD